MATETTTEESRIIDLEIRYTHQESLVQDLSEIIRVQQETISRLEGEVKRITKILEGMNAPNHERPPHY
tara:strand:- start:137 stop:343 length:207 start_codon:yes stop_codon:yes gene_type:complete